MKYYKGMDISTLLEVERCGGKFYDKGEERELLSILKDYDVNALRVRLWNHPYSEEGKPYGAGTNDFEAAKKLLRRGKDLGFDILLTIIVISGLIRESSLCQRHGGDILWSSWNRQFMTIPELH